MKRSMDIRWAEVRVGIFLLLALFLLAVGIIAIGQKTQLLTEKTRVQVLLPNVQGLKSGAPVWLSGVVIGTVADIAFINPTRSDEVMVSLNINSSDVRRLGTDPHVTIRTRGLLGEKYVDITPGSHPGALPRQPIRGETPLGFDQVVAQAYEAFGQLGELARTLENRQGTLGKFLQDPTLYDNLVRLSGRLQTVLGEATEGKGSLAQILRDPRLYKRLVAFSNRGEQAAESLQRFVASLQDPHGSLSRLAHDPALYEQSLATAEKARQSMERLDTLLGGLQRGKGTAGKLVTGSELHDQLLQTLKDLDALTRDMKEHPGRYVRFTLF